MVELVWLKDINTFKYKEIYTLELEMVKLNIVFDTEDRKIASGMVVIKGAEYLEPNLDGLSIEEAKRRLMWGAINIGSSRMMKNSTDPEVQKGKQTLIDNLDQIYIMIEADVKLDKERFKAQFRKGGIK